LSLICFGENMHLLKFSQNTRYFLVSQSEILYSDNEIHVALAVENHHRISYMNENVIDLVNSTDRISLNMHDMRLLIKTNLSMT
jgi:hypothetical protein